MTPPLLDTHAWIWWMSHDPRLGRREIEALEALPADRRPYLSDISLWEVATLAERGRVLFDLPFAEWVAIAAHPRTVHMIAITPAIAAEVASLPPSFHRDPADRIIVATSRVLGLPVLTKDRLVLRSRLVQRWRPRPSDRP